VESKKITMRKDVIVVTGSSLAAYGSLDVGVGRGSGEAQFVSDIKIENACQCQWGYRECVKMGLGRVKFGLFQGCWNAFLLTFTDTNHVSVSACPVILRGRAGHYMTRKMSRCCVQAMRK
jgi:hypothetical protein